MTATALLAQIADIGRDPVRGGYSRHLFDDADLALREWFVERAAERGLRVERDGNGNLWAWWDAGDLAAPAVVTGSHLDSVPGGGAYDGPLGVVSALAAVQALREERYRPRRPIAVCVFAEEEGARFNAPCLGSRLLVGELGLTDLADRVDARGTSFSEVWTAAGGDLERIGADPELLARVGVFVELHVEQGLDLAHRGAPVAVAEGILAHGRWRATFTGEGNHAGTTPMDSRHDPVVAVAQAVLAVRRVAASSGALLRGTVGRVEAVPGGSNVIASRAHAWVDVRAAHDHEVRAAIAELTAALGRIAADEGCEVELVEESFSPRVDFDPALRERLASLLGGAPVIPTGAGHDAGILSAHVPSAMLFVRNPTGVSHAPAESAEAADVEAGVEALAAVLRELAEEPG